MSDAERPPEKPTVEMPKVPEWAVAFANKLEYLHACVEKRFDEADTRSTAIDARMANLEGTVATIANTAAQHVVLIEDLRNTDRRHDDDVRRLSDRVKLPSSADLKTEATLAAEIVKNIERDQKITETHALVVRAATKEDVANLAENTATKAEVSLLVDAASAKQTEAIISGVKEAAKNPMVRMIFGAIGVLVLQALALATAYLSLKSH